jgi:hypothetical protein
MDRRCKRKPIAPEIYTVATRFRGLLTDEYLESFFRQKGSTAQPPHPRANDNGIVSFNVHTPSSSKTLEGLK